MSIRNTNFHFDAGPYPDPDWHQNDADQHEVLSILKIRNFVVTVVCYYWCTVVTALSVYNDISFSSVINVQRCTVIIFSTVFWIKDLDAPTT
jgi:hypothetical protein